MNNEEGQRPHDLRQRPPSILLAETMRDALKEVTKAIREGRQELCAELTRIADHFDPPTTDIVGTNYVAKQLGCTPDYVGEMARHGTIPTNCKVPGTGNGKKWKFYRKLIDRWIESR